MSMKYHRSHFKAAYLWDDCLTYILHLNANSTGDFVQ